MDIELYEFGLEITFEEILRDLRSVLGNNSSKKDKDAKINKTIGAIETLKNLILVCIIHHLQCEIYILMDEIERLKKEDN